MRVFSIVKNVCAANASKRNIFYVIPLSHILYSHLRAYKGSGDHIAELGSILKIKTVLHLTDPDSRRFTVQRALVIAHGTSSPSSLSLAE